MTKEKQKKSSYISYRAVRDFHLLVFLLGNYIYWERFYGFNNGFYSMPTFMDMLPLTIIWTIILIIHFWFVKQIHKITAERDILQHELDERARMDSIMKRLREEGQWQEMEIYEAEKPKYNHRS